MDIPKNDKGVLRELGRQIAEIAADPMNDRRRELHRRIENLEKSKPFVHIYELPWHEMDIRSELKLRTKDAFCQSIETDLRRTLYLWRHVQGDMIVEPFIEQPLCVNDSGFGITEQVDIARTDANSDIVSRHFHIQIMDEDDIEKIKTPKVSFDKERTDEEYQARCEIFDGVLPVKKRGWPVYKRGSEWCFWFNPWDDIVRWTGIQEVMVDMFKRPDYVHAIIDRLVDAWLSRLDQYEGLGLLQDPPMKAWGVGAAQIFAATSPAMHEEFALRHEARWYERFGLNYYGCCEPLHHKVDVIKKNIPRLRKISISPFADFDKAVENIRDEIVFAWKPNPAILATSVWNPAEVRKDLEEKLEKAKGCVMEIHMKDISTVRYQPQRLWQWAQIAVEVTEKYAM